MTADGLMTAIRRILQSITGRYQELYPKLEVILQQPILVALNDPRGTSVEEAISCLSEILYNQSTVSQCMWGFFSLLSQSLLQDEG